MFQKVAATFMDYPLMLDTESYVPANPPRLRFVISLILCSALVLGFIWATVQSYSDTSGLYELVRLGAIQLAPFCLSIARGSYGYLDFVLISHFVSFTLARVNASFNLDRSEVLTPELMKAVDELLICTLIMIATYTLGRLLFFKEHFRQARYEPLVVDLKVLLIMGAVTCYVPLYYNTIGSGLMIPALAANSIFTVGIFTVAVAGRGLAVLLVQAATGFSTFLSFLTTGSMGMMGHFFAAMIVSRLVQSKFTRGGYALGAAMITLVGIQAVKHDFRSFSRANPEASFEDKAEYLGDLIENAYVKPEVGDEKKKDQMAKSVSRLGDDSLETVLSQTPSRVPFWEGETYEAMLYMFIPRFLWPEKPQRAFWNKFGRLYGILSEDDMMTSVGVGFLGEAYMNFGFQGLYIVAALFAFLMLLVERTITYILGGDYQFLYIAFLVPLLPYGSDLGTIVNSIVITTGFIFMVRPLLRKASLRDAYSPA